MGSEGDQGLGLITTVVALVNGMIGGSILVLPLTSLEGGWVMAIIVIIFTRHGQISHDLQIDGIYK